MANVVKATFLDKDAWWSLAKGALIAGAGAGLTYLTQHMGEIDFGPWTATVAAGFAIGVNYLRKWLEVWGKPELTKEDF